MLIIKKLVINQIKIVKVVLKLRDHKNYIQYLKNNIKNKVLVIKLDKNLHQPLIKIKIVRRNKYE